jgi:hypothetical protein
MAIETSADGQEASRVPSLAIRAISSVNRSELIRLLEQRRFSLPLRYAAMPSNWANVDGQYVVAKVLRSPMSLFGNHFAD